MGNIVKKSMILFLRLYKAIVSNYLFSLLCSGCKYQKTCSEFAIEAVNEKGVIKGSKMSLKRFLSCQPFSRKYYATLSDIK
jgi:hypothetical protein